MRISRGLSLGLERSFSWYNTKNLNYGGNRCFFKLRLCWVFIQPLVHTGSSNRGYLWTISHPGTTIDWPTKVNQTQFEIPWYNQHYLRFGGRIFKMWLSQVFVHIKNFWAHNFNLAFLRIFLERGEKYPYIWPIPSSLMVRAHCYDGIAWLSPR